MKNDFFILNNIFKVMKKIIILLLFCILIHISNKTIYATQNDDFDLNCYSDIAIDFDSGKVLYNNNMNMKIYPASTTKILTGILVIENSDLDKKIIVPQDIAELTPKGSSVMGVKAGEIYTIEELLYGLMLPSGNDAAIVLAEAISGSIEKFVDLMNQKLQEIGCYNTHFVNPHGFHDDNHYTTVYDMAKLFRYCIRNETFKKIIQTKEYTIDGTNLRNEKFTFYNTNRLIDNSNLLPYYEYVKGGKTGYTDEARNTLISYAIKDKKTIIVASFGGKLDENKIPYTYSDTKKIYEYCFNNFYLDTIAKTSDYTFKLKDDNESKLYNIKLEDDVYALTNTNDILYTDYKINIDFDKIKKINKNYKKDDNVIGTIEINYNSREGKYNNIYNLIYVSSEGQITFDSILIENIYLILTVLIILLIIALISHFIIFYKFINKKEV